MREGWEYRKLGEVATFSRGLTYSKNDVSADSSKRVLRSNNIDLATHSLILDDVACLKEEFEIPVDKMLRKNDIFICMSNGSTQHLGKVAFIENEIDYAFGGFMGAIHPKVNEIFPKYAFYSCLSSEYRNYLASVLNGININNLKWSDLSKFPIPVPPLPEQERIVSELDLLQSIIEKKKAQLKEYDQLAQSIFYDMFGDPVTNEKGWEVKKLGEIGNCISGGTPSRLIPSYFLGDINWFSAGELNDLFLSNSVEKITEEALNNSNAKMCPPDSLFIGMYDTAAFKLGIPTVKSASNQACANVTLYEDNVIWLYYSLLLMREEALKHRHGARQKNLNLSYIKSFVVPLPPLPLQQQFAAKIEAIEHQKSLIQQSITEMQTLFDSRMDYWFN